MGELLRWGADPNVLNVREQQYFFRDCPPLMLSSVQDMGDTPLHCSVRIGSLLCVETLLKYGAMLDVRCVRSPVSPCRAEHPVLIRALVRRPYTARSCANVRPPGHRTDVGCRCRRIGRPIASTACVTTSVACTLWTAAVCRRSFHTDAWRYVATPESVTERAAPAQAPSALSNFTSTSAGIDFGCARHAVYR
jgi:hypothetical protein